jgi:pimeloyl-ACP methyl ester carboxylesterase
MTHTHVTAPTEFVEANGMRFAYRRFGKARGRPLVFMQHFTGTIDNWDPRLVDLLAGEREAILFDNAGIGGSNGETPNTVQAMARDALSFIDALGLEQIDLLGFSLGRMVAQQVALEHPALVRRLVLAGTGPAGGEGIDLGLAPTGSILADASLSRSERQLRLFFAPSETSQSAGRAFQQRMSQRKDPEPPALREVAVAQSAAIKAWGEPRGERYARLKEIRQPVLVANGIEDVMIPTINSYILSRHLPNAQLILYPDAGHGAIFQHSVLFAAHVGLFLNDEQRRLQ